uniref:Amine oxidase n=1 Tax=Ustilago esculenta TaxID=185366 RepID=A0AAU7NIA7_9BASI
MVWKPSWLGDTSNQPHPTNPNQPSSTKRGRTSRDSDSITLATQTPNPTSTTPPTTTTTTTTTTTKPQSGVVARSTTTNKLHHNTTGGIDVVIVGAGLSGLIAADQLTRSGLDVKILEANDRVGGRTLDLPLDDGNIIEMGGQWIGPGQSQILNLINQLGLQTHNTYDHGSSLYRSTHGKLKRYKNWIPCGLVASVDLWRTTRKINALSRLVPSKTSCRGADARYWDERSIGGWIDDTMWSSEARKIFRLAIKGVYAEDSESISFLDLLATVSGAGGDIEQVLSDAQTTRIVQGPQAISKRLADRLPPGTLELNRKVFSIHKSPASSSSPTNQPTYSISTTQGQTYEAPVVIITPPRPLICQIDFQPPLPSSLIQYYRRQPMGSIIKFNIIYPTPFWRKLGLNGGMINADESSPIQLTYDNSPADAKLGVIVAFVLGNNSRRFVRQNPDKLVRRQIVLHFLSTLFGSSALEPCQVLEMNWTLAPYATGGYGSFNPPGVLTSFEEEERDEMSNVGNLFFAGDATSHIWQGYMEGALLSGTSVSTRILDLFHT